jgi:CBS domain-containing protein
LARARRIMVDKRVDYLPVLSGRKLTGILTSAHITYNLYALEAVTRGDRVGESIRRLEAPVKDFAEPNPLISSLDETAQNIIRLMIDRKSTYALIQFWGEIQGIITHRDLVRILAETPEEQIPMYMVGLPEDPFEAEAAKIKFLRALSLLRRITPKIIEARSMVKISSRGVEGRNRYEVKVNILTYRGKFTYADEGWDLAQIYDRVAENIKRLVSRRRRKRGKPEKEEAM